jgi:hypothetical protein
MPRTADHKRVTFFHNEKDLKVYCLQALKSTMHRNRLNLEEKNVRTILFYCDKIVFAINGMAI